MKVNTTMVERTIKEKIKRKSCKQFDAQVSKVKTSFLLQRYVAFIRDGEVL